MIAFIIILILSLSLTKGRLCEGKYSLSLGVCELCKDNNCLDCTGDSRKCKLCAGGYHVDSVGECIDCDGIPDSVQCLTCHFESFFPTCDSCFDGFRLANGKCIDCTAQSNNCKHCTADKCVTCETGSVRDDDTNKCIKCNSLIPHC